MKVYTVKETAQMLKTNTDCIYKLIHTGALPAAKIGSYKIRESDIENLLERMSNGEAT